MADNRKFVCVDCNHQWEVPYGTSERGREMQCPKCGGNNIHRVDYGGRGRGPGGGRRGK